MTRQLFTFGVFLCVAVSYGFALKLNVANKNQQKYTNKYEGFDVDSVLNNERILKSYVKCLTGEGPCTKEGRELSQILPDAIKTECSKCDEKQKAVAIKVFKFLNKKYPDLLEKLMKKYDPKGEYTKKFKDQVLNAPEPSSPAPIESTIKSETKPPSIPIPAEQKPTEQIHRLEENNNF